MIAMTDQILNHIIFASF